MSSPGWPQARLRAPTLERPQRTVARGRGWRSPPRALLALGALFVALLLLDALLYQITLPVVITSDGAGLSISVGGVAQRLPISGRIVAVSAPPRDPVIHEYQLDGSDHTNNFTLDPTYLSSIANTPYYRLYAWMRDLDGLSRWRDLCASDSLTGGASAMAKPTCLAEPPLAGASLTLPALPASDATQRISARVQRPETPVSLALLLSDSSVITVTIDRNAHAISVTRAVAGQPAAQVAQWFFPLDTPQDTPPLAAMVVDFLARVALWALALLALVCAGEALLGFLLGSLLGFLPLRLARPTDTSPRATPTASASRGRWLLARWRALTQAIHPIGLLALVVSFGFVVWIALAQYHAQPHIYDASAYLFGAKIFAAGRLWAPIPPALDRFPGPFIVADAGKWFPQYEPGAALTLAPGVALGAPWLVEPLLGTLALLGVGLIARRLYDRRVATLAVLLGAASPFYSYLAASYLSHTIALFYLVWGFWALLRFLGAEPHPLTPAPTGRRGTASLSSPSGGGAGGEGAPGWALPLAGACWVMAALTRDTSVIFIAMAAGGALWLGWRSGWPGLRREGFWRRWRGPGLALASILMLGLLVYLAYNSALTGDAFTTPRSLFFPGDHYGFGLGVGFYGQHTLAAGFITLDELLTSLAISLYGWPFYLTLAFLLIPFLARRARAADLALLLGACAMTFAFIGFYYHGIYLGPRYLFEALPFYLILTARGFGALGEVGRAARAWGAARATARATDLAEAPATPAAPAMRWLSAASLTGALAAVLIACWLTYYLPRQLVMHANFTGMAADVTIQTAQFTDPPLRHALVITGDRQLYGYTLFGLNDPLLRGNVIYAEGASASDFAELRRAFPDRQLYILVIAPSGAAQFIPIS